MPTYDVFIDGKPRTVGLTRNGENSFTATIDNKRPLRIDLLCDKGKNKRTSAVKIEGKTYKIELPKIEWNKNLLVRVDNVPFKAELKTKAERQTLATYEPAFTAPTRHAAPNRQTVQGEIAAPMTGKVVSVKVKKGDRVEANQVLCVVEAMKMENEITAVKAGTIQEIRVSEGSAVTEGGILFIIT